MSIHVLRKRFVKDRNLPIQLLQDPYFEYFLDLYDPLFDCRAAYEIMLQEVEQHGGIEPYLAYCNQVVAEAVAHVSGLEAYKILQNDSLKHLVSKNEEKLPQKNIYHPDWDGAFFSSIDLSKANFHAFRHYDLHLVDQKTSYEDWLSNFTNSSHLLKSKYIRQVIFGNLNPKKQIKIQEHIMARVVNMLKEYYSVEELCSASSDEVVIHGDFVPEAKEKLFQLAESLKVSFHSHSFILRASSAPSKLGFVKEYDDGTREFKAVPSLFMAQAFKNYFGIPLQKEDFLFFHEGYLASFIEPVLED